MLKLSQIKQELSGSVSLTSLSLREDDQEGDYATPLIAGSDDIDLAKEEYGLSREEIAADMRIISGRFLSLCFVTISVNR